MIKLLKSLFSKNDVVDTAAGIVKKLTGTDWTAEQEAKFILDYAAATKHQSPARRFIAISITCEQILLSLVWIVATIFYRVTGLEGCGLLASDVSSFLESNVNIAMNVIVSFYFIITMKK